jgi:hypothetical protein
MVTSYEDDMSPFPSKIILIFVEEWEGMGAASSAGKDDNKQRQDDMTGQFQED